MYKKVVVLRIKTCCFLTFSLPSPLSDLNGPNLHRASRYLLLVELFKLFWLPLNCYNTGTVPMTYLLITGQNGHLLWIE